MFQAVADRAGATPTLHVVTVARLWRKEPGDELISGLERVRAEPASGDFCRLAVESGRFARRRIFEIQTDSYLVADEESQDGGITWVLQELLRTVRKLDVGR